MILVNCLGFLVDCRGLVGGCGICFRCCGCVLVYRG